MTYTNCWKPVHIVHVVDDDNPERTLCGLEVEEPAWEYGAEVEDSGDEGMYTCERCGRAMRKAETKAKRIVPEGEQR